MESLLFPSSMSSNSSSLSEEPNSLYSITTSAANAITTATARPSSSVLIQGGLEDFNENGHLVPASVSPPLSHQQLGCRIKKKRNLPGNPDPDAEVVALSPKTLLATNRFVCEICNKGFQRDQNLQLHRRGHNLPWKLKKRSADGNDQAMRKRVYVCPEPTCVHHDPTRALGDLTGIKKHYSRKHGEKKWKCDKCSKVYAVQSDWKAHSKTCGTREYRCDCGTLFARKDSFITHRAFCDALAEESARLILANQQVQLAPAKPNGHLHPNSIVSHHQHSPNPFPFPPHNPNLNPSPPAPYALPLSGNTDNAQNLNFLHDFPNPSLPPPSHHLSATAFLQQAATLGATPSSTLATGSLVGHHMTQPGMSDLAKVSQSYWFESGDLGEFLVKKSSGGEITRDFMGLRGRLDRCHTRDNNGEGSSGMAMKPYGLIQNSGLQLTDPPAITNVAAASSRLWG